MGVKKLTKLWSIFRTDYAEWHAKVPYILNIIVEILEHKFDFEMWTTCKLKVIKIKIEIKLKILKFLF